MHTHNHIRYKIQPFDTTADELLSTASSVISHPKFVDHPLHTALQGSTKINNAHRHLSVAVTNDFSLVEDYQGDVYRYIALVNPELALHHTELTSDEIEYTLMQNHASHQHSAFAVVDLVTSTQIKETRSAFSTDHLWKFHGIIQLF